MLNCTEIEVYWEQFKDNELVLDFVLTFLVLGSLTSIFVICTNVVVIYTIAKTRRLQTLSNILILALAVGDFLVGVAIEPPYIAKGILIYKRTFDQVCLPHQVYSFIGWTFFPITSLNLAVLTLDRFLALHFHLRYEELISWKHYCVVFISIWLYGLATGTIYIVRRDLMLHILSVFFICNFLTFVCILNIVFTVRRHSAQIASHQQASSGSFLRMSRLKKSLSIIYFVIGAFVFCHIPYVGFIACLSCDIDVEYQRISAIVAQYALVLNSLINPIIYFWRIRKLRKSAIRLLFGRE